MTILLSLNFLLYSDSWILNSIFTFLLLPFALSSIRVNPCNPWFHFLGVLAPLSEAFFYYRELRTVNGELKLFEFYFVILLFAF